MGWVNGVVEIEVVKMVELTMMSEELRSNSRAFPFICMAVVPDFIFDVVALGAWSVVYASGV